MITVSNLAKSFGGRTLFEGVSFKLVPGRRVALVGTLARTLVCTNMIESMISISMTTTRNVKRWRNDGDMRRRWCAAGLPEAERKFRRVRGHTQMPYLVTALDRHAPSVTPPCDTEHNKNNAA